MQMTSFPFSARHAPATRPTYPLPTTAIFIRSVPFEDTKPLAARGETPASHRDGRGAPLARRDDREYREYLSEEQRGQRGCIARRMQSGSHHGLLKASTAKKTLSMC